MTPHQSDSTEQRTAEVLILGAASEKLGVEVAPRRVDLPGGAYVHVDGVADDPRTFIEIYAHLGPLKGGHVHKIAQDILKLVTLHRAYPDARLALVFADSAAAARFSGTGWLAEAVKTWDVDVVVIEVPQDVRAAIEAAQLRQVMVNPPKDPA